MNDTFVSRGPVGRALRHGVRHGRADFGHLAHATGGRSLLRWLCPQLAVALSETP